jgi:regulation of enolase protein 1 (concanavalin A-like superfamily)
VRHEIHHDFVTAVKISVAFKRRFYRRGMMTVIVNKNYFIAGRIFFASDDFAPSFSARKFFQRNF